MALASLILGSLACLFALLPIYGAFITVPLAATGIPLGAIAFKQNKKKPKKHNPKIVLIGLTLSISSLPILVIATVSRW